MRNERYCGKHNRYHRCRRVTVASGQKQRSVPQTSRVPRDSPAPADSAVAVAEIVMQVANTNLIAAYDKAFRRHKQGQPAKLIWAKSNRKIGGGKPTKYTNGRQPYSHKVHRGGMGTNIGIPGLGRRGHAFEKVY